jgi:hypothetical protein
LSIQDEDICIPAAVTIGIYAYSYWSFIKHREMANLVITTGIVFNLFVFYLVYRVIEHEITKRKQAQAALGKALSELEPSSLSSSQAGSRSGSICFTRNSDYCE